MTWSGRFSDFDLGCSENYTANRFENRQKYQVLSTENHRGSHSGISNRNITKIENISLGIPNITVIGIVLSKEAPKSIFSKKSPGAERYLLNFVIRDSPSYFASVTCWGNELFVKDLASAFHIGNAVEITNVQVQQKSSDGSDEKFRPWTPVPFYFSISENHSSVTLYKGSDLEYDSYRSLLQIPTKANNDYYTLEDVIANGQNLHGEHINLLAVVRKIGQAKDIKTRSGKQTKRCELKLMDETCSSFAMVLWDEEIIDTALTWMPLETVVFVSDARVSFDDFRKTMTATADSKTIFIVNPDTLEAHSLYQFAHSETFSIEEDIPGEGDKSDPSLETITDIYSIAEIKKLSQDISLNQKSTQYGIGYVFITHFDIDTGDLSYVLRHRCEKCRQLVYEDKGYMCTNPECTYGALYLFDPTPEMSSCKTEYAISVSLSDHTGTVDKCHLDGPVAEQIFGAKAEDFRTLALKVKTQIKWTYLLERCKVYFKLFRTGGDTGRTSMRIISCSMPSHQEVISGLSR